jgi:hypothetical protein
MTTIFLVTASFSSWDSYHTRNLKAFYKREDADLYAKKADRVLGAMSDHIAKAFSDADDEDSPTYNLSLNTWSAHSNLEEFGQCSIEEIRIK